MIKRLHFLCLAICTSVLSYTQPAEDTTDGRFHDTLLNHLAGNWSVTAIAHGSAVTSDIDAAWVLNHQYMHIHLKSRQVIPWIGVQMEYEEFIGYNHNSKRYVVHGMSIEGDEDPSGGFGYAYRTGNELKTVMQFGTDSLIVQRFTWQPLPNSWSIQSTWQIAGKEREVFLDMKLEAVKPSSK